MNTLRLVRLAASLAVAALSGGPAVAAEPAVDPRAVPAGCPAAEAPVEPVADWPLQVRTDSARVLAAACAALRRDPGDAAMRVWAAEALHLLSRNDAARAALQSMAPDDGNAAPPPWRAHWYVVSATIAHDAGLTDAARRDFEQAQIWLDREGLQRSRLQAVVWTGRGLALQAARDLAGAAAMAERARALLVEIGAEVSLEMSDVYNLLAVVAANGGRRQEAVEHSLAEIEIYKRLGRADDPELIDGYATIGSELSQLGRHDEAEAALRAGLALIDAHPDASPNGQVGVLGNLAAHEISRGAYESALRHAERADAVATRFYGEGSPVALHPVLMQAIASLQLGRYAAAAQQYERAQAIGERHRQRLGLLRLLRVIEGRAMLLLKLGDVDAAREVAAEGARLADADAKLVEWQGRMAKLMARGALQAGQAAEAATLYERAVARLGTVNGPTNPFVLGLVAEQCEAQLRARLGSAGCAVLQRELPGLDGAAPGHRFGVHAALAHAALQRGERDAALNHRLAALAAASGINSADPLWIALDDLAQQLRDDGRHDLADYFGKEAVAAIQTLRGELGRADENRFLRDKVQVYRRVADWLASDGRTAEAIAVLRLLKAEEFDDYVRGEAVARTRQNVRESVRDEARDDTPLTAAEQALRARWRASLATLPKAAVPSEAIAPRAHAEAGWAAAAPRLLDTMQAELAKAGPAAVAALPPPAPPPAGTLEVHAIAADTLTLLLRSSAGQRNLVLARSREAASREIGQMLAAMSRGGDALPQLQALHAWLGAPVEAAARAAKARRIALYMDGVLRYVPFAALHDGQGYVGERYAVESFTAAAAAPPRPSPAAGGATRILAFGVTRDVAGMKALRGVDREVCAIVAGPVYGAAPDGTACSSDGRGRGFVPGEGWLNEQFTATRLQTAAAAGGVPRSVLHIGSHFSLRPGDMGRSWLLLGDGTRLPLRDLVRLDFERDDLVVLSACETGLGGGTGADGREVEGFNMLVARRGARAVLASLWPVDDASTGALMEAFYRELGRGGDASLALQRAQAAVRERVGWAAPRFWAGFYLTRGTATAD